MSQFSLWRRSQKKMLNGLIMCAVWHRPAFWRLAKQKNWPVVWPQTRWRGPVCCRSFAVVFKGKGLASAQAQSPVPAWHPKLSVISIGIGDFFARRVLRRASALPLIAKGTPNVCGPMTRRFSRDPEKENVGRGLNPPSQILQRIGRTSFIVTLPIAVKSAAWHRFGPVQPEPQNYAAARRPPLLLAPSRSQGQSQQTKPAAPLRQRQKPPPEGKSPKAAEAVCQRPAPKPARRRAKDHSRPPGPACPAAFGPTRFQAPKH